jgi:hypothetical protein
VTILANKEEVLGGGPRVATGNVTGPDITDRSSLVKAGKRKAEAAFVVNTSLSGKLRRFGWPCPELKKNYSALILGQVN